MIRILQLHLKAYIAYETHATLRHHNFRIWEANAANSNKHFVEITLPEDSHFQNNNLQTHGIIKMVSESTCFLMVHRIHITGASSHVREIRALKVWFPQHLRPNNQTIPKQKTSKNKVKKRKKEKENLQKFPEYYNS